MESNENLLDEISFDNIEPGRYFSANPVPALAASVYHITSNGVGKSIARTRSTRSSSIRQGALTDHDETFCTTLSADVGKRDELIGLERAEHFNLAGTPRTSVFGRKVDDLREKTPQILALEKILAKTYSAPDLSITNIEDLPVTRKEVRKVSFTMKDSVYQIWVFKADPKTTLKEMTSYYIASKYGIPTAKPIGFVPKEGTKSYPYDLAILGGVVEHAGEPYNQLISKLKMDGSCIFKTATSIARLIADFHYKLTKAGKEFDKYGIKLERADPREEIRTRFMPALSLNEKDVTGLMDACGELYGKQKGSLVISHGDIHTRNIVTISSMDTKFNQPRTSLSKFGLIDFESLEYDYPEEDLADFWLHHLRDAYWASDGKYRFFYTDFETSYIERMVELKGEGHIDGKNRVISSALWNLYEMFDPVRKDGLDIQQKARFHAQLLRNDLFALAKEGNAIGKELKDVLARTEYKDVWQ
jgi:thiamine kinase-like enzyme